MADQTWEDLKPPGKYLGARDVAGKTIKVTVSRITTEQMPDKSIKAVAYFEEIERGVVLNATRRKFLQQLSKSPRVADCVGLKLQLVEGVAQFQGDEVPTIKFQLRAAEVKKQVAAELDDKIPF